MSRIEPKLLIFSGGTALNSICSNLKKVTTNVAHIIPISDSGGSTAEIVRVVGGPAIGDIRSRMVRLAESSTVEARAVQSLLQHRLHSSDNFSAKIEWLQIVEGSHDLWQDISEPYKETIRAFLVHFNTEVLKNSNKKFNFCNGSIGNFFFTGARLFFNSLETAIFWFSRVSGIDPDTQVIPVINTNNAVNIAAQLEDGTLLLGQNNISHPPPVPSSFGSSQATPSETRVDKEQTTPLPSKIKKLFYINDDKHEVSPVVNPMVIKKIQEQDHIVYSMGSLWTSIIPSLVLKGVGEYIAQKKGAKILILNGYHDRETEGMTARDFVLAVTSSLNRNLDLNFGPSDYVTHLFYAQGTSIDINLPEDMKIKTVSVASKKVGAALFYQEDALCSMLHETVLVSCNGST